MAHKRPQMPKMEKPMKKQTKRCSICKCTVMWIGWHGEMAHGTEEKNNKQFRNFQRGETNSKKCTDYRVSDLSVQRLRRNSQVKYVKNLPRHGTGLHAAHRAREPQWYDWNRQSSANTTASSCDACIFYIIRRIHLLWNSILESLHK